MDGGQQQETGVHVRFLRDRVADNDQFGAHSRIAKAIAKTIRTDQATRVIGLLGDWGSGKSTVLHLLKKDLEHDDETGRSTHFFVYDAWIHQSDPVRRAFLEKLIEFLENEGLTKRENWQRALDRLTRRSEEHDIESTPTLTGYGKWIIPSVMLFPVGVQLIGKANEDTLSVWFFDLPAQLTGLVLVLLPFLIVALALLVEQLRRLWSTKSGYKHREQQPGGSVLTVFVNKQVDRVKNRIIKTPDPTAIEFRELFREVFAKVANEKRRLVFVIDNLDRIPEQEAATMWSTVRSFFAEHDSQKMEERSPSDPWVILPLDPNAVRRIHARAGTPQEAEEISEAFLEKTFDVVYRVNPPVVSDWQAYFETRLRQALGAAASDDVVHTAIRILEKRVISGDLLSADPEMSERSWQITPRRMNAIVNEIAALRQQWGDEVPLTVLALYVIYRRDTEKNLLSFIQRTDVKILMAGTKEGWERDLVAVHFGVDPDRAMQVLIADRLFASIDRENHEEFRKLAAVPGFPSVLRRLIDRRGGELGWRGITVLAALIEKAGLSEPGAKTGLMHMLRTTWNTVVRWPIVSSMVGEGIRALLKSATVESEREALRQSIRIALGNVETAGVKREFAEAWLDAAAAVSNGGNSGSLGPLSVPDIEGDGAGDFYLAVTMLAWEQKKYAGLLPLLVPKNEAAVIGRLAARAIDARWCDRTWLEIEALAATKQRFSWHILADRTADTVLRTRNLSPDPDLDLTAAAFNALAIMRSRYRIDDGRIEKCSDEQAKRFGDEQVGELIRSESLYNVFLAAHSANHVALQGAIIGAVLLKHPLFYLLEQFRDRQQLRELVQYIKKESRPEVEEQVIAFVRIFGGSIRDLVQAHEMRPDVWSVARKIFQQFVREGNLGEIDLDHLIEKTSEYLAMLDPGGRDTFVDLLAKDPRVMDKLGTDWMKQNPDNAYKILQRLARPEGLHKAKCASIVRKIGEGISKEAWEKAIQENAQPVPLVTSLVDEYSFEFGTALSDALIAIVDRYIVPDATAPDQRIVTRWSKLGRTLSPTVRAAYSRTLRDRLLGPGDIGKKILFLDAAPEHLWTEGDFDEKVDESIKFLVAPMLEERKGRNWLRQNAKTVSQWIRNGTHDSVNYLAESVGFKVLRSLQGEKPLKAFLDLAKDLGLERLAAETRTKLDSLKGEGAAPTDHAT